MDTRAIPIFTDRVCLILLVAAILVLPACNTTKPTRPADPVTSAQAAKAVATPAVDPAAVLVLKRMTDYVGGLKQFSVRTQNTLDDILEMGQRVQIDISARATFRRPSMLRAERMGEGIEQAFFYDGKNLTLFNPADNVFATVPAPKTIDGTLHYAREELDLVIPAADLVYTNSLGLLMQDVTFATVVGKGFIHGVSCDHVLFSRPGVDFQLWVADSGNPLPYKYVVTDTAYPDMLSTTTVMSDWNVAPVAPVSLFTFAPPAGAVQITFMPLETTGAYRR